MKENLITLNKEKVLIKMANKALSVKTLCEKAEIFNGTYRRMIKGAPISTATAGKVAKALGCKVEDLI